MCKLYKVQIKTLSLLPIMVDCAGMGVDRCSLLPSPPPSRVGERGVGGRALEEATSGQVHFTFLSHTDIWLVLTSLMHPLSPITLERGRQASLT